MRLARIFLFASVIGTLTLLYSCSHEEGRSYHRDVPTKELEELNLAIRNAPDYEKSKMAYIDSLKKVYWEAHGQESHLDACLEVAHAYLPLSADSSLHYSEVAMQLCEENGNQEEQLARCRIMLLNSLAASGIFMPARDILHDLEKMNLSQDLKIKMWGAARQLFAYMHSYISDTNNYSMKYEQMSDAYDDSLINVLPASDTFGQFLRGERFVTQGKYGEAQKILKHLLEALDDDSRIYGMAAFQLAEVSKVNGDQEEYARLLALASTSDVKRSVKEGLALPTLAYWLYRQGELNLAFSYINFSLNEAMQGNARMRLVEIARSMPMIDEAYRHKINSSRDELMIYFLVSAFLFVVSAALLVFLYRQMKRDMEIKRKLKHTSEVQESYIANFIGMVSAYADKLESMTKMVTRKLNAGQTDDLLKMVKSGKFSASFGTKLDELFDRTFLDLYPDFVFDFNKLLRPEERIYIPKGQGLTTELRIYALVRLGVEESTKISQILHYSLNTIYTYRHKMRSKAIDKENFDRDVAKIGRHE